MTVCQQSAKAHSAATAAKARPNLSPSTAVKKPLSNSIGSLFHPDSSLDSSKPPLPQTSLSSPQPTMKKPGSSSGSGGTSKAISKGSSPQPPPPSSNSNQKPSKKAQKQPQQPPQEEPPNPHPKPTFSYASLIGKAILASEDHRARLNSIYNWIATHYPYYRLDHGGWQNSIRHNLTVNKCFVKDQHKDDPPGKGSYWTIHSDHLKFFETGVFEKPRVTFPTTSTSNTLRNSPLVITTDSHVPVAPGFHEGPGLDGNVTAEKSGAPVPNSAPLAAVTKKSHWPAAVPTCTSPASASTTATTRKKMRLSGEGESDAMLEDVPVLPEPVDVPIPCVDSNIHHAFESRFVWLEPSPEARAVFPLVEELCLYPAADGYPQNLEHVSPTDTAKEDVPRPPVFFSVFANVPYESVAPMSSTQIANAQSGGQDPAVLRQPFGDYEVYRDPVATAFQQPYEIAQIGSMDEDVIYAEDYRPYDGELYYYQQQERQLQEQLHQQILQHELQQLGCAQPATFGGTFCHEGAPPTSGFPSWSANEANHLCAQQAGQHIPRFPEDYWNPVDGNSSMTTPESSSQPRDWELLALANSLLGASTDHKNENSPVFLPPMMLGGDFERASLQADSVEEGDSPPGELFAAGTKSAVQPAYVGTSGKSVQPAATMSAEETEFLNRSTLFNSLSGTELADLFLESLELRQSQPAHSQRLLQQQPPQQQGAYTQNSFPSPRLSHNVM